MDTKKAELEDRWEAYCDGCGKKFWSDEAVSCPYPSNSAEYGNVELASPCCGTDYSDRPRLL